MAFSYSPFETWCTLVAKLRARKNKTKHNDHGRITVTIFSKPKASISSASSTSSADLLAWYQVNSKYQDTLDEHSYYWWRTSGYTLASLLCNAGYSGAAQRRSLEFFVHSVAPRMGISNKPGAMQWKSFMTDNHNPIELSWDWHTGHKAPQIRFSVEPVGLLAGSAQDPRNELMAMEFMQAMKERISAVNLLWFNHFEQYFGFGTKQHSLLGHQSNIFWAFDLTETEITNKVYFFPGYRALATGTNNLQVIIEAIKTAPSSRIDDLGALYMFEEFAQENLRFASSPLEMDMLAIDLVKPSKSRLKIYFRSRQTSFHSVRQAMTLGGRVVNDEMEVGLQNLRQLWDRLFDQQGVSDDVPLSSKIHRTAGLLYNVEFKLGSKAPKVKIYIPVRHYAQNDWHIMNAVGGYVSSAEKSAIDGTAPATDSFVNAYYDTMKNSFGQDILRSEKGRQTYVGCSVQSSGLLRVVSYINPKEVPGPRN